MNVVLVLHTKKWEIEGKRKLDGDWEEKFILNTKSAKPCAPRYTQHGQTTEVITHPNILLVRNIHRMWSPRTMRNPMKLCNRQGGVRGCCQQFYAAIMSAIKNGKLSVQIPVVSIFIGSVTVLSTRHREPQYPVNGRKVIKSNLI